MLLYMTKTRPDIATAVSFASTHSCSPTVAHFNEMLYIVRYLKDSSFRGLTLHPGFKDQPLQLTCYVDASYLTHQDSKSQSGYCLSFGTLGAFYSKSSKQSLVATSSTHAEIRALQTLTLDILFIIHLCTELYRPLTLPCIVFEDNQPLLDITSELSKQTRRCKHFLMLISFLKEQINLGFLSLQKIDSARNYADILTKIVTGVEFERKALWILGIATPSA